MKHWLHCVLSQFLFFYIIKSRNGSLQQNGNSFTSEETTYPRIKSWLKMPALVPRIVAFLVDGGFRQQNMDVGCYILTSQCNCVRKHNNPFQNHQDLSFVGLEALGESIPAEANRFESHHPILGCFFASIPCCLQDL